ncbi:NACHT domain-containing protein [Micromonospora palomenae]|uniref:NACHT domain-containing protein n=1 Tax=Micromonospora palomenae TaxID=1461247 RepID=UPI003F89702D
MPDTLSYADAVRLLGGEKSRFVDWFDKLTGGALLAAAVPLPALLSIFDAKGELVRLGHELMRSVAEKRSGLSRYGRTQRLEAAHAVIAVTAFFEALSEADLPFDFADLELRRPEQLSLAGTGPVEARAVVRTLFEIPAPLPGPELPYPALRQALLQYFTTMAGHVDVFVDGLALRNRMIPHGERAFQEALGRVPAVAVDRHRDLLTALAVDFAEVAYWSGLHEHEATRGEVRALAVGLVELREALAAMSTGRVPTDRRDALAGAYRAQLDRPIITSGEVPDGLRVPALGEAYVPPLCRLAAMGERARPSDESWWAEQPVRDDLVDFLTGYLTSSRATRAPLLVLGQPGSGKSVLTRVLAAQLPATDFLVVRVVLREVRLEADLQDQIEQAIRDATGERLDWPALARSAGDALPVILLDGFDELLQASGVTQTDYLLKVAAFQRREADQGRPVAVLVTTRTSVADRAKPPSDTLALRLEPFDPSRVARWVATWNAVNADRFPTLGVPPLDPAAVLAHRELAEQPLLLLMLALYDADGNDLHSAGTLRRGELYERLLRSFARREVLKHQPGLSERETSRATERELRRLAVVAFAMFNRGVQWVTEEELEADLAALPFLAGESPGIRTDGNLRAPLRAAEIVLGRFFFVHRAQAVRGDRRAETYEFLHATFGEFLVARTTALVLGELAAREAATSMLRGASVDDDPLHALLSFATLTGRAPIVGFLAEALQTCGPDRRSDIVEVLLRLFRTVHDARPARHLTSYLPRALSVPERHAVYSANLFVLGLCAAGELSGGQLYPAAEDVRSSWTRQALLWRAQLAEGEYRSLVNAVALDRLGDAAHREIRLRLADESWRPPTAELAWTYQATPSSDRAWFQVQSDPDPEIVRRMANFECGVTNDVAQHALEPLVEVLPPALNTVVFAPGPQRQSMARVLLAMLLRSRQVEPADRAWHYRTVASLLVEMRSTAGPYLVDLAVLLFDRLATDGTVSRALAAELLGKLDFLLVRDEQIGFAYLRCCLALIEADDPVTREVGHLVKKAVHADQGSWGPRTEELAVDALVRLSELGVAQYHITPDEAARLALLLAERRPDLIRRIQPLVLDPAPVRSSPGTLALPGAGPAD